MGAILKYDAHEILHLQISLLSPDIMFQSDKMDVEKNALLELLMEISGTTFGMKKALVIHYSIISTATAV